MAIYFALADNHKYILKTEPWHYIISSHFGTIYKLIRLIIDLIESLFFYYYYYYFFAHKVILCE